MPSVQERLRVGEVPREALSGAPPLKHVRERDPSHSGRVGEILLIPWLWMMARMPRLANQGGLRGQRRFDILRLPIMVPIVADTAAR